MHWRQRGLALSVPLSRIASTGPRWLSFVLRSTKNPMEPPSASRRYVLLYREVELGEVLQRDADFPNCSGTWTPSPSFDNPEIRSQIRAYVEFSEHADSLLTPDFHSTPAWEAYTRAREPEFLDLIESRDWALRDASGVRHPLVVPNFCVGEIVWRWDARRAG